MAIVVNCPECQRKLKIAPASIGKSVKCPCGNVFKAQEADEPPLAMATPVAPATLLVACDNCQAKLKVPASARGRKMKCSKCSATFVVPMDEAPAAPPEWSKPTPPASSKPTPPALHDDEPADEPRPAKKSSPSRPPFFEDTEADEPAPARKSTPSRPPFIEDDEGAIADVEPPRPRAKGKPAGRAAVATEPAASQSPEPASGCGGCVLSLFVLFIVIAYAGAFVALYSFRPQVAEYVELPFKRPPPELGKGPRGIHQPEVEDDKKDNAVDNDKKDHGFDNDKGKKGNKTDDDQKDNAIDKDKKDNATDKDKKDNATDKDKKDSEDKEAASDRDGVILLQFPMPALTASPAPAAFLLRLMMMVEAEAFLGPCDERPTALAGNDG